MVRRVLVAAALVKVQLLEAAARPIGLLLEGVAGLGREPNLGSLETMVGMLGGSSRGGADIRPRPLHHGDPEQEELPGRRSIRRQNAEMSKLGSLNESSWMSVRRKSFD